MARLSIRVDLAPGHRLGPGKVALLEAIGQTGSISAAGRHLGMSYKRAWDLVDALNRAFREPVVLTRPGGRSGGGAALTALGQDLVRRYRQMEAEAARALAPHLAALDAALDPGAGPA